MADSIVFGEGVVTPHGAFKDTRPLQEAFVLQELSHLPKAKLKEFMAGPECKYLVENDIISGDTLERLANEEYSDKSMELVVCHMASENEDERWNELVRHRAEERRLMNELIGEYGDAARTYAESYREDFVYNCIPKGYRSDN